MRKPVTTAMALLLALLAGGELFARYGLGLGTPPLYEPDPVLEYRMVPNQHVWRFGNLVETNERGMRSPALAGETRRIVLVAGDSVPNGGSQTDQRDLATSLLSDDKTVFANMSAGSWGPANELAALRESEDLDAAATVVILNSEDLPDVPTFAPLDSDHPQSAPASALWEAVTRYLPNFLLPAADMTATPSGGTSPADWAQGRRDLDDLLSYLHDAARPTCVVLHPTSHELQGQLSNSNREIAAAASARGVTLIDQYDSLSKASDHGRNLYRDDIHPNVAGQKWLASSIHDCLTKVGFDIAPLSFALAEK